MIQRNFMYFNMADPVASSWVDDGNMYPSSSFLGMNTTGANTFTMFFKPWNGHVDAPDDIVATIVNGTDTVDQTNRLAGMDAMVSKANTVNKQGFVVAFSEIENVKPGGIASIVVTLDA